MLSGNLASIGVGGIVSVVWSLIVRHLDLSVNDKANKANLLFLFHSQYPDNFNFDLTRAINAPHHHHNDSTKSEKTEFEKDDGSEKGSNTPDVNVQSVDDEDIGITDEKELDRAALQKSFNFAAWSSVALVGFSGI